MVTIQTNATELIDKLGAIASKQMPFVMAQTLSGLAFDVRDIETAGLDRYFKIRTNWSKRSLKAVRAEKRDYPDQSSIVGIRDKIMALNVTGGSRTSDSGTVAAPGSETRKLLNPGKETLNAPRFPNRVLSSKKTFYGNRPFLLQTKSNKKFVAVRTSKERKPLEILYTLKDNVQIDQNWPFVDNAREIVRSNYAEKFSKNLSKAL
jgi:hypothetical protein